MKSTLRVAKAPFRKVVTSGFRFLWRLALLHDNDDDGEEEDDDDDDDNECVLIPLRGIVTVNDDDEDDEDDSCLPRVHCVSSTNCVVRA